MDSVRKVSQYLVAWGLWLLTSAAGVFIEFWAVRDAIGCIAEVIIKHRESYGTSAQQFQAPLIRNAIDRFSVLTLGILAVVLVVLVETYYRTGVDQHQLGRRFVRITLMELGVLFVALVVQTVSLEILGLFTIWSILIPCGVLTAMVMLTWVLTRMPDDSSLD